MQTVLGLCGKDGARKLWKGPERSSPDFIFSQSSSECFKQAQFLTIVKAKAVRVVGLVSLMLCSCVSLSTDRFIVLPDQLGRLRPTKAVIIWVCLQSHVQYVCALPVQPGLYKYVKQPRARSPAGSMSDFYPPELLWNILGYPLLR